MLYTLVVAEIGILSDAHLNVPLQASQQVAKPLYDAKVQPSTLLPKQVGNMYTASLYAAFVSVLHNKHSELVSASDTFRVDSLMPPRYMLVFPSKCDIFHHLQSGKRVVMFSYGSGLTATMFSFQLRDGQHPFSLSNIATVMDVAGKLKARHEVLSLFFIHKI